MPAEISLAHLLALLRTTGAAGVLAALAVTAPALVCLWRLLALLTDTAAGQTSAVRRAGGQIRGQRAAQEDDLGFIDGPTLDPDGQHPVAVVADGMGGHASGDLASRLAVRAFVTAYAVQGAVSNRMRTALGSANQAIAEAIREHPGRDGMGTTLVAAALTANGLEWISVGDSPLFLYRDGRLKRLNDDHSMAPVIAAMLEVDPETAEGMNPHELRSALVGSVIAKIDASTLPELLRPGDVVLLASDGLATLDDDTAAAIIENNRAAGPAAIRDALLAAVEACRHPTQDNATVALLEAPGGSGASVPA